MPDPNDRSRPRLSLESPELVWRTGRGVRIAVVDSGIAAEHPHVGVIAVGICLGDEGSTNVSDRHGHGTAAAAAIREEGGGSGTARREGVRSRAIDAGVLAEAIRWAADSGAQLINLSLGTPNEEHRAALSSALEHATLRGALVVAAVDNNGQVRVQTAIGAGCRRVVRC